MNVEQIKEAMYQVWLDGFIAGWKSEFKDATGYEPSTKEMLLALAEAKRIWPSVAKLLFLLLNES